jgi:hypothetical protein
MGKKPQLHVKKLHEKQKNQKQNKKQTAYKEEHCPKTVQRIYDGGGRSVLETFEHGKPMV